MSIYENGAPVKAAVDAALPFLQLVNLGASGQIHLRKLDDWLMSVV